ncbi:MAG TPA: hypothetical protein VF308_14875 [Caldimonas sp.]
MIAHVTEGVGPTASPGAASAALPAADAWRLAAKRHDDLFAPLDPGARIGLLARSAPTHVLVWEAGDRGIDAWIAPFAGYSATAADIVLAADDESLAEVRAAGDGALFEVLRAGIRSGHIVCYMLKRRCVLEERGFDELLDALGFAFMGACR